MFFFLAEGLSKPTIQGPKLGSPCVVQYIKDRRWYRGQIVKMSELHSSAAVLFVKVGILEQFPVLCECYLPFSNCHSTKKASSHISQTNEIFTLWLISSVSSWNEYECHLMIAIYTWFLHRQRSSGTCIKFVQTKIGALGETGLSDVCLYKNWPQTNILKNFFLWETSVTYHEIPEISVTSHL